MIQLERRRFIAGLATLLAAPAIVRASSLMAVKPWEMTAEEAAAWLHRHIQRTLAEYLADPNPVFWSDDGLDRLTQAALREQERLEPRRMITVDVVLH